MTTILPILCRACVHYHLGTSSCDAFPSGIPSDILTGADHHQARHGDHGIRFERAPGATAEQALSEWRQFMAPRA